MCLVSSSIISSQMAEERDGGGKGAESSTDTSEGEARDATEEEKK